MARYRHQPWSSHGQCAIDAQALPDEAQCHGLMALAAELFVLEGDSPSDFSQRLDTHRLSNA